ncbi:mannose-6-phosphate isomerase, class I [Spirochaetia bacterium 38H-sp]|uniref:mannose-6-phosphate isomerase n=1 Tax=Rarispira pelagica TaxID=3141764 RepID=A0ABU9UCC2_9SPIR
MLVPGVYLLENSVQNYAWGSKSAFSEFLAMDNPDDMPMAELWMGAHPKSPSFVIVGDNRFSLLDVIASEPEGWLGECCASRFGSLPFLFKVLGIASPLSIQAHPDKRQAEAGFARENEIGIPLDAANRNYKDDNHKPEVICALTPFWALRGFREPSDIIARFRHPAFEPFSAYVDRLEVDKSPRGLAAFFEGIMSCEPEVKEKVVSMAFSAFRDNPEPEYRWLERLFMLYPGDIGVLAPLYLNLVKLAPGEAMFLPAGVLHAYLEGVGVELMANSDNVLRGGCTPKHVDVKELMRVLRFESSSCVEILRPQVTDSKKWGYSLPTDEFSLTFIEEGSREHKNSSIEILILIGERASIEWQGGVLELTRGQSAVIAGSVGQSRISVEGGRLYCASVPCKD